MSYSPLNTSVYLRAFAGFLAGATASANTSGNQGDYTLYTQMADAWAQEVDTTWGSGVPTSFELLAIDAASEAIWENRSVLATGVGVLAGSYAQMAAALVARVVQANTQVVSQGINPGTIGTGVALTVEGFLPSLLDTPVVLTGTPLIVAATDLLSKGSGIFVASVTLNFTGSAIDVVELALQSSLGITAGYAGGSSANSLSNKSRYLQGGVAITGGTGGSGYTAVSIGKQSTTAGGQTNLTVGGLFAGPPGTRFGLEAVVLDVGSSNILTGTINMSVFELPLGAAA
jgi:hypothetical protein